VRGVDYNKYAVGIGQEKMALPPPDEDIVTLAAGAALPMLERRGRPDDIELLLFATESGIDQSKAAGHLRPPACSACPRAAAWSS
jgi:hydroxymethylglutaryl-CoA synthase